MERHLGWLLLFVGPLAAEEPRLVVTVNNQARFDEATVAKAEGIVTRIFGAFGVRVEWRNSVDAGRPDLLINLVAIKPAAMGGRGDAVGFAAVPRDGQAGFLIWIFRPVLERLIDNTQYLAPNLDPVRLRYVLLAHTMAHEMGHLLLNTVDHPGSGIMTRAWPLDKIQSASTERLGFLPRESERIRAAVEARNRGVTPALPASPRRARR